MGDVKRAEAGFEAWWRSLDYDLVRNAMPSVKILCKAAFFHGCIQGNVMSDEEIEAAVIKRLEVVR